MSFLNVMIEEFALPIHESTDYQRADDRLFDVLNLASEELQVV